MEFNELVQKTIVTCTQDRRPLEGPRFKVDRLIIESKASGLSVAQEVHRLVSFAAPFGIELINPQRQGDKVARVHSIQHLFSDGMVWAPDKAWADEMIEQCAIFPRGSHDDLVDSMSMAMRYLRDCGFALKRNESELERHDEMMYRSRPQPLYPV